MEPFLCMQSFKINLYFIVIIFISTTGKTNLIWLGLHNAYGDLHLDMF